MILFYSQNSPYSRIARIALRESGLISIASERLAANRQPDNPVLEYSPVGRVPTGRRWYRHYRGEICFRLYREEIWLYWHADCDPPELARDFSRRPDSWLC